MKISHGGFAEECGGHRVVLLPVVQFSFEYRCTDCGGIASMGWDDPGASMQDIVVKHMRALATALGVRVEFVGTQSPATLPGGMTDRIRAELGEQDECPCHGSCRCHQEVLWLHHLATRPG